MTQVTDSASKREPESIDCYWCHVPLGEDGRCPSCGRRQVKVCYCGEELYPDDEVCPHCGADWAGVVKVRRRRRRHSPRTLGLLQAAALGLGAALLLASLGSVIVSRLALRSADSSQLPETPGERLGLAWKTITDTLQAMGEAFASRASGAAYLLLLGLAGAMVGILIYLRQHSAHAPRRRDPLLDAHMARKRR